jgi:acyl-CoA hydrolase
MNQPTDLDLNTYLARGVAHTASLVFPGKINALGTLFGGEAMRLMDEVASIAALRCARTSVVTVASDRIEFHVPIKVGALVELEAHVTRIGRTSMTVAVELWAEDLRAGTRLLATSGQFTLVAVDDEGRPIPVISAKPS